MHVTQLRRYPVKSMLGESLDAATVEVEGLAGDRRRALLDAGTGRVATAKHPRLWRALLQCAAETVDGGVRITLPDGEHLRADDRDAAARLSALLGRRVALAAQRPPGAVVERPDPEDVIAHGVEADVPFATLEIAQGAPGSTFVDYAPVHLITTATLERLGMDATRYRPNVVVASTGPAFAETDWVGQEIEIDDVVLRVVLPTPRCSVPTLAHGVLPRDPDAVRPLLRDTASRCRGSGSCRARASTPRWSGRARCG
ncbi:MAG: MOSC domain-containing protein [Pseudonocardia sp.]